MTDRDFRILKAFVTAAHAYAGLGDAITSQLDDFVESDGDPNELPTEGALRYIEDRLMRPLRSLFEEIDEHSTECDIAGQRLIAENEIDGLVAAISDARMMRRDFESD